MKRPCVSVLVLCLFALAVSAVQFSQEQSGKIAKAVGTLLDTAHYSRTRLDDAVSESFLKNYLDALDYNHLFFLQADVDEFYKRFGKNLDDFTNNGDAGPAFEIFGRFLRRLDERTDLAIRLLKETHDFTRDEALVTQRNKSPWPKDDGELEELWRARIKFDLLQGRLNKDAPDVTVEKLRKRFLRVQKTFRDYETSEILQVYLTALGHAFDPHSDYMAPEEAKEFEVKNIKLSLIGIGALLEYEDGYTRIKALTPGGPADKSKLLKPGDRIIGVAQGAAEPVDVVEMPLAKVVNLIRGKLDTEVRLTIIPGGSESETRVIKLTRKEIPLADQKAKSRLIEHPDAAGKAQRLGVINLPQFYDNCASDVEKLLQRLQKENISGLVLDLRRNGGGLLPEAIELAGLFIKKGPVVQVKDNRGKVQVLTDEDAKVAYDGPLIVLVSHLSASASEIVAAALQDYGRALVVGDSSTHGKGTVQTLIPVTQMLRGGVPDAGKLKFTVQKFYRVEGTTTQKVGVTPALTLPSIYDVMELGESSLPNCLPADSIAGVKHDQLDLAAPFLNDLRKRSAERVAKNRDFGYLHEDIERARKLQAEKTVSLNEQRRITEKKDAEARVEARKKERAARGMPDDKVFEITLDTAKDNKPLVLARKSSAAGGKDGEAIAATQPPPIEGDLETENDAAATVDPHLLETLNILADYCDLLAKSGRLKNEKLVLTPVTK
jgi:carboxyl-terminal processing protease